MKAARAILLSLTLIAFSAASSLAADLSQVVRALEQGYTNLKDVQADFTQKSVLKMMKREESGAGELYMKKSGKESMFRFNYTKPKQQIVSNGKTVWYYLPDQKQVLVMDLAKLFEGGNGIAMNYLSGMGQVSRDFKISFAAEPRDKKGNYQLELVPHKKSAAMAKLLLTIDGSAVDSFVAKGHADTPFPIVASTVIDQTGNSTRMEYGNVKANRGVSAGTFSFKTPSGVRVIQNK